MQRVGEMATGHTKILWVQSQCAVSLGKEFSIDSEKSLL
jgi:hypothetical protein